MPGGATNSADAPTLAAHLSEHFEEIVGQWEERVRAMPAAHSLSGPELRDHIPVLLREMVELLRHDGTGEPTSFGQTTDVHANHRLDAGFSADAAAGELAVLRAVILDSFERRGGGLIPVRDVLQLNRVIDDTIGRSVTRFAEARDRTLLALDRVAATALTTEDPGGHIRNVLDRLAAVLLEYTASVDAVTFLLRQGDRLETCAGVGLMEGSEGETIALGQGFIGKIASEGRPITLRDGSNDPLVVSGRLRAAKVHALYGMPLFDGERVIGVAHMASRTAYEFSDDDRQLFRAMVHRATAALILDRARQKEREAARNKAVALAQLRTVLQAAPVGVAFLDPELRYQMVNPALAVANGRAPEDHIGRRIDEVVPRAAAALEPLFRRVMEKREPVSNLEVQVTEGPSAGATWLLSSYPVVADDDRLLGIGNVLVDISDIRRLETERRRMADALDHGDAFFLLDPEFRVTLVNRSQELLSRKPRSETLGRVFWEIWPEAARPDDKYWKEYHRCMRERVPVQFEEYFAPLDLWTGVTAYPTSDGGIAVFFRDVSTQKRLERQRDESLGLLDSVIVNLPVGIAFLDRDFRYVKVNQAIADINGATAEESIGRSLDEVIPALADEIRAVCQRVFDTGESVVGVELSGLTPANPPRLAHWLASYFPIRDPNGRVVMVGAVVADITRLKASEREIRRRVDFEEQLIGIVSHDLRNPLNAILLGVSALLGREDADPRTLAGLVRIRNSAQRASRLIRDLLDFTQARLAGSVPIFRRPGDIHLIAQQVVEEVQAPFPDRALRVNHVGDGQGSWDPDRIGQVISNLLTNAFKYGAPDTPVTLTTRGDGDDVFIEVHNLGEPISSESMAELFQPLRRGRTDRSSSSVGLGLFIVEHIVRAHGGVISVESTRETGTRFLLRLARH